ncbi:MAG: aminotransferase class III-fold pyridoxal phosphate-dependent enzyme, partial [Candidatus Ranarchaeia archaeon]
MQQINDEPDWDKAPLIRGTIPGPKARQSVERNNRYITNMSVRIGKMYPLVFNRAKNAVIEDVDGNLWIDFSSSITAVNAGHSNPKIVKAVQEQIARFSNCYEYPSIIRGEVAELLCQMTPGSHAKRVAFTSTGSESIEMALRFAEWYTEKHELFSLWEQYHGKTRGSSSLTTVSLHYRKSLTKLGNCYHIPYPWCDRCPIAKDYPDCGFQ